MVGLLIPLLGIAPHASAQPAAADRETARQLMDEGDSKSAAKDFEGALDAYRRANDLMHVPSTGIELARAYERTGRFVEARDAALEVTRHEAQTGESKLFAPARTAATELAAALAGRLASIELKGFPAAASVKVDGVEVPAAARGVRRAVNPGAHTVVISKANCTSISQQFTIAEKEHREVAGELVCSEPAVVVPEGPIGGQVRPIEGPVAPPPPRTTSPLAYVGFGVGAVGLGLGAVTGLLSLSKTSQIKQSCINQLCPAAEDGARRDANTLAWVSNAGFIVGLAGAVVGSVFLLSGKSDSKPTKQAFLTPTVSFGQREVSAGVSISLR